eukprot:659261-Heterocapsa_arctica.AAC.1
MPSLFVPFRTPPALGDDERFVDVPPRTFCAAPSEVVNGARSLMRYYPLRTGHVSFIFSSLTNISFFSMIFSCFFNFFTFS